MNKATDPSVPEVVAQRRVDIGERITELRGFLDIDRPELAARIGVDDAELARWEAGEVDLTFEQALAIELVFDLPRGTIGAAGRYVAIDVTPASLEDEITSIVFDHPKHLWRSMKSALDLGLGVRVRNQHRLVEDTGTMRLHHMEWVLDLSTGPVDPHDPLD